MPHGIATRNDVVTLRRAGRHATGADPRPCMMARPWQWGMGRAVLVRRWTAAAPARDGRDALALRIAGVAMRPLLRHLSLSLEPPDAPPCSASGRCPYCNGEPDFATVGRNARILYCARCDAAWRA